MYILSHLFPNTPIYLCSIMTELIPFNVKLTNPFCRTCFSMGNLGVYVSVHPSERTFQVKRFNFVTALCFIPLRYIINLLVKELIALNPYGNLQWDVAPKPELLEPSSVHPSLRQHLPWVSCERNSSDSFVQHLETLHVFSPWYEDMHVVWM